MGYVTKGEEQTLSQSLVWGFDEISSVMTLGLDISCCTNGFWTMSRIISGLLRI